MTSYDFAVSASGSSRYQSVSVISHCRRPPVAHTATIQENLNGHLGTCIYILLAQGASWLTWHFCKVWSVLQHVQIQQSEVDGSLNITACSNVNVSVSVTNTGTVAGDEGWLAIFYSHNIIPVPWHWTCMLATGSSVVCHSATPSDTITKAQSTRWPLQLRQKQSMMSNWRPTMSYTCRFPATKCGARKNCHCRVSVDSLPAILRWHKRPETCCNRQEPC